VYKKIVRRLTRLLVKVDLYKINIETYQTFDIKYFTKFEFLMITDMDGFSLLDKILTERGLHFREVVENRLQSGNYICFLYKNVNSNEAVYYRWLTNVSFFHGALRENLILDSDHAFTLDSYTSVQYRGLGLHKQMNKQMLNFCKNNLKLKSVRMVIYRGKAYLHLHKTVQELGYELEKSKTYIRF
jgi:hypothetical protein